MLAVKAVEQLREERLRLPKKTREIKDLMYIAEEDTLCLPASMNEAEDPVLEYLLILSSLLGFKIGFFRTEAYGVKLVLSHEFERFMIGMKLNLLDPEINFSVKIREDAVEVGRVASYAIRLRSYFRNHPKLGLGALRRNHTFFANSPEYVKGGVLKYHPIINQMLYGYFEKTVDADKLAGIICSKLEQIGLKTYSAGALHKIVEDNIVDYNDISARFRRVPKSDIKSKVHATRKEVGKLPEKPTSSPLFLPEEMKVIAAITSPLWNNLSSIQQNWTESVLSSGFDTISDRTKVALSARWTILTNFASLTTTRLQSLRKEDEASRKLSKRSVKSELLHANLAKRQAPRETFLTEVRRLIANLPEPVVKGFNEKNNALLSPLEMVTCFNGNLDVTPYKGKSPDWKDLIVEGWVSAPFKQVKTETKRVIPATAPKKPTLGDFSLLAKAKEAVAASSSEPAPVAEQKKKKKPNKVFSYSQPKPPELTFKRDDGRSITIESGVINHIASDNNQFCQELFGVTSAEFCKGKEFTLRVDYSVLPNLLQPFIDEGHLVVNDTAHGFRISIFDDGIISQKTTGVPPQ
jgi:hypothetical protein